MSDVLSFENVAKVVAKLLREEGVERAETACARFQRTIGWDSAKLLQRAREIVSGD